MKQVIILATAWEPNYWDVDKEAPYPKTKCTDLPEWDELARNCPLPGLGVYTMQGKKDYRQEPFVYLKITHMRCDGKPYFTFKAIKKSSTKSEDIIDKLPSQNKSSPLKPKLFSAIDVDQIIKILSEIGEEVPKDWLALIELTEIRVTWYDYIGKYFLDLREGNLSYEEFEDRVANLLKALGFEVSQKGHKTPENTPDGVATFEDEYHIVYDCKNTSNFIPTTEDNRAIKKYLEDEGKILKGKIFGVFIARSFGEEQRRDIFYFRTEELLYLLYKKLSIGRKFNLAPLKKILDNKMNLTIETIDKEWLI